VAACKQHNNLPLSSNDYIALSGERSDCFIGTDVSHHRPQLSANTFTVVEYHDANDDPERSNWVFVKKQCMHCLRPSCVSACPVAALEKHEDGPVFYHPDRCMGCRYCMMACPFNVITYQWDRAVPFVRKCTFCIDRTTTGEGETREDRMPACVAICPTQALLFGQREEMLGEARRRIEQNPELYVNQIYGEFEAGGTSWLYISAVPFEKLAFPQEVGTEPYPEYTETALKSVPPLIIFGGTVLSALYMMWRRKIAIQQEETSQGGEEDGQ
jgi:formate dehydrogenase iron-sulfur subunit